MWAGIRDWSWAQKRAVWSTGPPCVRRCKLLCATRMRELSTARGGPKPGALRRERKRATRAPTRGRAHPARKIARHPLGQHQKSPRRRVTLTRNRVAPALSRSIRPRRGRWLAAFSGPTAPGSPRASDPLSRRNQFPLFATSLRGRWYS
eukprot:651426-Pyramimonas_sp.AAC.1